MDKLMYVIPSKEYEQQAIDFINEFYEYKSQIEGVNGLHKYLTDYDAWLEKINEDKNKVLDDKNSPTETYFLVRESDNKIVGMATLRLLLNKRFSEFGGNIGYCIRPTERGKGYNKVNLYLALLEFDNNCVNEIMIDCDKENIGSAKTIKSLGGKLVKEQYLDDLECIKQDYTINVKESIIKYALTYENYITTNNIKTK